MTVKDCYEAAKIRAKDQKLDSAGRNETSDSDASNGGSGKTKTLNADLYTKAALERFDGDVERIVRLRKERPLKKSPY